MITCADYTRSLTDYMEGRTDRFQSFGLVLHTMMCAHCRRYRNQMQTVVRIANTGDSHADAELPPAAREDELVAAFARSGEGE